MSTHVLDEKAMTKLAREIARALDRHRARRPTGGASALEALTALAFVATNIITAFEDDLGRNFFDIALRDQIARAGKPHRRRAVLDGEPEGEA